jgi:hypothetical protein
MCRQQQDNSKRIVIFFMMMGDKLIVLAKRLFKKFHFVIVTARNEAGSNP